MARKPRRKPEPKPVEIDEQPFDQYAKVAADKMRKVDLMPPEFRALVHEYGYKVRTLMAQGYTVEQIRAELSR